MPRIGDPLPAFVAALLDRASTTLGWQLAAQRPGADVAALVCDRAVPWPLSAREPGHVLLGGYRCAVLPRWQACDVLLDSAPELAPALQEVLGPGLVWCVTLWREDGRERCLAVPYRPPPEAAR